MTGSIHILSDCLGALNKVKDLPPYQIPTQCSHSNILKNIMANCSNLSFSRIFSHIKAHEDNKRAYGDLPRDAQLNCQMDYLAKMAIFETPNTQEGQTKCFPLEPICVILGNNKVTSDKGERVRFWVHWQIARACFHELGILNGHQFDLVDWTMVHTALCWVPRIFQIWTCRQVMDIAPAGNRPWERTLCPLCPSCAQVLESCSHVLYCSYKGRVDAMMISVDLLLSWMAEVDTDPDLRECIVDYAKGQGALTMSEICQGMDTRCRRMARDQDEIGWQRFMEGMVMIGLHDIQTSYSVVNGSNVTPEQWTTGVVIKLLETTHSQWLYRCIQVHDRVQGPQATLQKEVLQKEIEAQQELGYNGLLKEGQYLAEINLNNLETSSGE